MTAEMSVWLKPNGIHVMGVACLNFRPKVSSMECIVSGLSWFRNSNLKNSCGEKGLKQHFSSMHVLLAYLVWGIFSMPVLNYLLTDCSSSRCRFIGGCFTKMWSYPVILFFLEKFCPCFKKKKIGKILDFFQIRN
jgi:hypothetical protein